MTDMPQFTPCVWPGTMERIRIKPVRIIIAIRVLIYPSLTDVVALTYLQCISDAEKKAHRKMP